MILLGLEARHLELMKVDLKKEGFNQGKISRSKFDAIATTVLKNRQKEMIQASEIVINFCSLKDFTDHNSEMDPENVSLDTFNILADYLTYHPHKVKRNKNHSVDI